MERKSSALKKELSLLSVYAIATGATLSSGFFLLPGLAANEAGSAVILAYLVAAIPLVPTVFSMAELSTAMPRAGGVYYYLDRSMGPMWGTIGGLGTWLALTLKAAFALVGMGAYLHLILPDLSVIPLAVGLAMVFGVVNLFGAKKTGDFQVVLVLALLAILFAFAAIGIPQIDSRNFKGVFSQDYETILETAGLVYVSYVGVTKIASVSEEVRNPEKTLPRGMILAQASAIVIYLVGTAIMVGVLSPQKLAGDLTPVATTAASLVGDWGMIVMTVAALLSFLSVANAGILSASRYPLAMSRDNLLPSILRTLSRRGMPILSIAVTVVMIIIWVTVFDPTKIAKLASAFQLLLCAFSCLAVIVMRESYIESYDPGFRSPLYPGMQIFGIVSVFVLIGEMGFLPMIFTVGLIFLGYVWYMYYARDRVVRDGAIYHMFARLGERRYEGLDRELRGILKEKGLRERDPFEVLITRAQVIDLEQKSSFAEIVRHASVALARKLPINAADVYDRLMQGTRIGATPVAHGAALPHLRLPELRSPVIVIVRAKSGVVFDSEIASELDYQIGDEVLQDPIFAFFFLVSPETNPSQHLRILAEIAGRVDDDGFLDDWLAAHNANELREIMLREECFMPLTISTDNATAPLIGAAIRNLGLPEGCLVALIHRERKVIVPRGRTVLQENDHLTIIGDPIGIQEVARRFDHADGEAA